MIKIFQNALTAVRGNRARLLEEEVRKSFVDLMLAYQDKFQASEEVTKCDDLIIQSLAQLQNIEPEAST